MLYFFALRMAYIPTIVNPIQKWWINIYKESSENKLSNYTEYGDTTTGNNNCLVIENLICVYDLFIYSARRFLNITKVKRLALSNENKDLSTPTGFLFTTFIASLIANETQNNWGSGMLTTSSLKF